MSDDVRRHRRGRHRRARDPRAGRRRGARRARPRARDDHVVGASAGSRRRWCRGRLPGPPAAGTRRAAPADARQPRSRSGASFVAAVPRARLGAAATSAGRRRARWLRERALRVRRRGCIACPIVVMEQNKRPGPCEPACCRAVAKVVAVSFEGTAAAPRRGHRQPAASRGDGRPTATERRHATRGGRRSPVLVAGGSLGSRRAQRGRARARAAVGGSHRPRRPPRRRARATSTAVRLGAPLPPDGRLRYDVVAYEERHADRDWRPPTWSSAGPARASWPSWP